MPSSKKVQNTHISQRLRELHWGLLDIMSVMNQPERDEMLIREAGVTLDRALFPLLVGIERFGPIGVVDLADRMGRDYTTISRQVGKLEALGLVARQGSAADGRVRQAAITAKGRAMTDRLSAARERIGRVILETWDRRDIDHLVRLLQKFAAAVTAGPPVHESPESE